MPNLLAMSFEGELAPSFDLRCLRTNGALPDGWGVGFYPAGEPCAQVLKEAAPAQKSIRSELVRVWQHLESSVFVVHVRTATWGKNTDANTQPFVRSWGGRDWVMAHAGSLQRRLTLTAPRFFEPVGSTDTEQVFCELLNRFVTLGKRTLGDVDPELLRTWLDEINDHGALTIAFSDGRDTCVYADRAGRADLHLWELRPPYSSVVFGDADLEIDLTRRGTMSRKGVVVSSTPLTAAEGSTTPAWQRVGRGELVILRQGAIRARVSPPAEERTPSVARILPARPVVAPIQHFQIKHRTVYRYRKAVERSTHLFRLEPMHDRLQRVASHTLSVSVDGATRSYEDVFGNRVHRINVDTPFQELAIEARSQVAVLDVDPLGFAAIRERSTIPLVWMPWQHHMLQPYLLPPELPESQLRELASYAMTFVERNDYDLLDTLLDINTTIYKEYAYRQAETTVHTTAFDVYENRRGVCQDFTNLFICLARLLGVPARYVCGYVYTGPKHANQRMGEASHAWVQVYLPEVGWRGLDPTNGTVTQTDHVRVAVGRSFVDATPTSGTLYVGGEGETLEVDVRVDLIDGDFD